MNEKIKSVFKKIFYGLFAVSIVLNAVFITIAVRKDKSYTDANNALVKLEKSIKDTAAAVGASESTLDSIQTKFTELSADNTELRKTAESIAESSRGIEQTSSGIGDSIGELGKQVQRGTSITGDAQTAVAGATEENRRALDIIDQLLGADKADGESDKVGKN